MSRADIAPKHPLTENEELAEGVLRLTRSVRYLVGIAERGEGRPMLDDETAEQFVLRYVQRLEQEISRLRSASVDTKRMDFMGRFIVEGTCPEGGKIAWLADVDCLREMIDEAMRVASDSNNDHG